MIVRKIKPEELKRTNELFSIAFEFPEESEKSANEVYDSMLHDQTTRDNIYLLERYAAFEDDNETMMSFFVSKPYPINFDGNPCTMTGIGGVATLPQYRRRGGIRHCFEQALQDMYNSGYEFSYLYPFSTAYYRKFGYELCCEKYNYHLMLSFIPNYNVLGTCTLIDSEHNNLDAIKEIHSVWEDKYNMMVHNEDCDYKWIIDSNPYKDQIFTYLYRSDDGIPKAYFTFKNVDTSEGRIMQCNRFVYKDLEGFKGILTLAKSFSSDHTFIDFSLPIDQYITPLIPEWSMNACSCKKINAGMARVIHVEKVLEKASYIGSGSIRFSIHDPYIIENNKTFYIAFENGKLTNIYKDDSPSNINLTISDFTRLIIGCLNTDEIQFLENIDLNSDSMVIKNIFYKKPIMITEYF